MVEILASCGEWKLDKKHQWEFCIDKERISSLCELEESVTFKELVGIVLEDLGLTCDTEITLTYELSKTMRLENSPPVCIRNDRQLRTFMKKVQEDSEPTRLCVSVSEKSNGVTVAIVGDHIANGGSNTQSTSLIYGSSSRTVSTVHSNQHDSTSSTAEMSSHPNDVHPAPDPGPVSVGCSYLTRGADDIHVNKYFNNKDELMLTMRKWALKWKFEFYSPWSDTTRVMLSCVDVRCTWRMRATRVADSDSFVIRKYVHEHTCDTTHRNANHRQATAVVIGNLVCSNFQEKKEGLKPKQIQEHVRREYGAQINYKKAWRGKENAEFLMRGSSEDSYVNLAKWLYMTKEKNPGTQIYLNKDEAGKFKYAFVAFGQSIRGFGLMRPVIAVDGTFLKAKYKGTLLAASAQDGDFHLYPLAFAIVDSENDASWNWFFLALRGIIPDASGLVFISDRAPSIAKAVKEVYPSAHHGICRYHLINNIKPRHGKFVKLVEAAANAYTQQEFHMIFGIIRSKNPVLAKYLEDADFKKWARCYAPSNRYNMMTTNIAESLNSMLKSPRELPIISLLETIRLTLSTWFHERRVLAAKHNKRVTPNVVKEMVARFEDALKLDVYQINEYEFEVKDESKKFLVHLKNKRCTCCVFDIDKIPCVHAIAACKRTKMDENSLVDDAYLTATWVNAYAESIHPCGDLDSWEIPGHVRGYICGPPTTKPSSGRPAKKRKRGAGEFGVPGSKKQAHKCGRCGGQGHNKQTCKTPI